MRDRYYIYLIKCDATGRGYVGRTRHLDARIARHFSRLKSGKHYVNEMQRDFDKYGENAFHFELLETTSPGDSEIGDPVNSKERKWQVALKTYDIRYGYNYKDTRFHPPIHKKKVAS